MSAARPQYLLTNPLWDQSPKDNLPWAILPCTNVVEKNLPWVNVPCTDVVADNLL